MDNEFITLQPNNIDTYVIIAIVFILILGFYAWVFYKVYKAPGNSNVYLECSYGMCATNINDGTKRCPQNENEKILYDPVFEVCNSRNACDNSSTPYAVQSDLSTSDVGLCEGDTTCLCLAKPQCAANVTVLWTTKNGSIYSDNYEQSNLTFTQTSGSSQGDYRSISYTDPVNQFCALQIYYLDRIAPGACPINTTAIGELATVEIGTCVQSNPCISGILAFDPNNAEDFHMSELDPSGAINVPLICTQGPITFQGRNYDCVFFTEVPVYDKTINAIRCYNWAKESYGTTEYSAVTIQPREINLYPNVIWDTLSQLTNEVAHLNDTKDNIIIDVNHNYNISANLSVYSSSNATINFAMYINDKIISQKSISLSNNTSELLELPLVNANLVAGDIIRIYGEASNTVFLDIKYPEGYVALLNLIPT